MAVLSGQEGAVTLASGYTAKLDRWEITLSSSEQDITGFEDASSSVITRKFIGGVLEWRGTMSGKFDNTVDPATEIGGAGTSAVFGTESNVATTSANDSGEFSGTVVILEVTNVVEVGSAHQITINFVGSGALTYTT
jgi:hypothetical protein